MADKKPAKKERTVDNRSPEVIFAERFNTEARLLERRYENLGALGNAKRACPTEEQLQRAQDWLRQRTEEVCHELGTKFRRRHEDDSGVDANPYVVLGEAPAKVPKRQATG